MNHPTDHIFDHTPESLAAWCADRGLPKFRAKQILEWVYAKGVIDPGDEMKTNPCGVSIAPVRGETMGSSSPSRSINSAR